MIYPVPFDVTVDANSEKTVASSTIDYPYTIQRLRVAFRPGCEGKVQVKIFVSFDDSEPAAEPSGYNILKNFGPVSYLVGDNEIIDLELGHYVKQTPTWIKLYCKNTDSYPHTISAVVVLDLVKLS